MAETDEGVEAREPALQKPPRAIVWRDVGAWVLTVTLTVVAAGLAWGGQALTTRHLPHRLSSLDFLRDYLTVYGTSAPAISAALVLLAAGGIVLGLTTLGRREAALDEEMLAATRPFRFVSTLDAILLLAVPAGLGLWAVFLLRLSDGRYHHPLNLVLLLALVLLAAPLAKHDFQGRRLRLRVRPSLALHLLFVAGVAGSFIYLNARDLGSWLYSAVGDEYNNFFYGLAIAKGAAFNPWSHRGADLLASVMGSAGQALFMRLGNEDNFAWRMYSVVITALAFIPFYFLLRQLFRAPVAVLGTIMAASSHYLFGYVHHGLYLDGLLPTTLGLWLLVVGLKRDSPLALFGSGLALGLGFYTFESGRAAVIVVCLFMLTFGLRGFRPAVFLPLAGGFILLVLPLFATDGFHRVIDQMLGQSAARYSATVTGDRWQRFRENLQYSFVSFNFNPAGRHYVWGSLADPLTAALFWLGLGVAAFRLRRPAYRLLVIWWLVELGFNGFSNPYPMPPISRLQATVLPIAALAAVGADAVMQPFTDGSPWRRLVSDGRWNLATSTLAVFMVGSAVLGLNLYRFWYQFPRRFGTPTNETVVVRAYREPQCRGKDVLIVAPDPLALLQKVFISYRTEPMPRFLYYPQMVQALNDPAPDALGNPACVIVQTGAKDPADQQAVFDGIPRRFPGYTGTKMTDLSGRRLAYLFAPQQ